jgi:hypothetical protein
LKRERRNEKEKDIIKRKSTRTNKTHREEEWNQKIIKIYLSSSSLSPFFHSMYLFSFFLCLSLSLSVYLFLSPFLSFWKTHREEEWNRKIIKIYLSSTSLSSFTLSPFFRSLLHFSLSPYSLSSFSLSVPLLSFSLFSFFLSLVQIRGLLVLISIKNAIAQFS